MALVIQRTYQNPPKNHNVYPMLSPNPNEIEHLAGTEEKLQFNASVAGGIP